MTPRLDSIEMSFLDPSLGKRLLQAREWADQQVPTPFADARRRRIDAAMSGRLPPAGDRKGESIVRSFYRDACLHEARRVLNVDRDLLTAEEAASLIERCTFCVPDKEFPLGMSIATTEMRDLVEGPLGSKLLTTPILSSTWLDFVAESLVNADPQPDLARCARTGLNVKLGGTTQGIAHGVARGQEGATLYLAIRGAMSPAAWETQTASLVGKFKGMFDLFAGEAYFATGAQVLEEGWTLGRRSVPPVVKYEYEQDTIERCPDTGTISISVTPASSEAIGREQVWLWEGSVSMVAKLADLVLNGYDLTKRDQLKQRVRRGLLLLLNAHSQSDSAVAITLAMAALESLLSFEKDAISDKMSRNLVTLLVPEASERLEFTKRVKAMYTLRSELVHGTKDAAVSGDTARASLMLVAAAIRAVVEWIEFRAKESLGDTIDDFRSELDQSSMAGVQVVGPTEWYFMFIPTVK